MTSVYFPRQFLCSNITPLRFTGKRALDYNLNVLFMFEKIKDVIFVFNICFLHFIPFARQRQTKNYLLHWRVFSISNRLCILYTRIRIFMF